MSVEIASSKIRSLTAMKERGVNVPEFTTDRETVQRWLSEDKRVLARTLDRASGGRGIILLSSGESIPQARLYTLYIPKYDEYRVHVWGDQVLDIQQKRRRNGVDEINSQIRNASNGWVFCREGVNCPEQCVDQARRAVAALGLDFGAVDVGFTRRGNIATVYEVNTAPGIEGTTLSVYANKMLSL
jgi:glutathione synthase/RimK-type ligase-like ATP-grasp enzyme